MSHTTCVFTKPTLSPNVMACQYSKCRHLQRVASTSQPLTSGKHVGGSLVGATDKPRSEVVPVSRAALTSDGQHAGLQYDRKGDGVMVSNATADKKIETQPADGFSHRWPDRARQARVGQPDGPASSPSAVAPTNVPPMACCDRGFFEGAHVCVPTVPTVRAQPKSLGFVGRSVGRSVAGDGVTVPPGPAKSLAISPVRDARDGWDAKSAIQAVPCADGETYDHDVDHGPIAKQRADVWACMREGEWRTLPEIHALTHHPEASISARLRDFRKIPFGGHEVERRRVAGQRLYQYRLVL